MQKKQTLNNNNNNNNNNGKNNENEGQMKNEKHKTAVEPIWKGREHIKSNKGDGKKLLKRYEKGNVEKRRHEEHNETTYKQLTNNLQTTYKQLKNNLQTTYKQPQLSNPHAIFKCKFNVIPPRGPNLSSLPFEILQAFFSFHVCYMPRPSHHAAMQNASYNFLRYEASGNNLLPPTPS